MVRRYAQGTDVSVAKTKAELEELLRAHGAKSTAVFNQEREAAIAFEMHDRRIVMKIALPARSEADIAYG